MTRRKALRALLVGAVGLAGGAGWRCKRGSIGSGETKRLGSGGGIRLERQATGSEVWQVTGGAYEQSNIYSEVPYCSRDSRTFVYERRNSSLPSGNQTEFVAVEVGTWKQHVLDTASGTSGCAISRDGVFYYLKQVDPQTLDLLRVDLSDGMPQRVHRLIGGPWTWSLGTVSSDGRYYVRGKRLHNEWKMFGILLVDLRTGEEKIIDKDPYIWNAHPQFEPGVSDQVMIQHNRGGQLDETGKIIRSTGPEGATLYLLSVPEGRRTTLQVGTPYTTPVTGHEAWIGDTREVLLTVRASGAYSSPNGNLLGVRAGGPARVVASSYRFNHVGMSRDGRFFCCDDWQGTCKLVIGSVQTGRTGVVCESRTSMGSAQNTHAHPYLTPDLKWVIFNSDRSGFPHIHAASVPEGMIEALSKA